jgi:hypothetical protein
MVIGGSSIVLYLLEEITRMSFRRVPLRWLRRDLDFPFGASLAVHPVNKIPLSIYQTITEEMAMGKKSMCILFSILIISTWVLGSTIQAGAETLKCRYATTATKDEAIPVSDEEGHFIGVSLMQGLAFFENGEIAKLRSHAIYDWRRAKGADAITYHIYTFEDGATFVVRNQRLMVADQSGNFSAKVTSEIIKGTGRFNGIKGTASATGKTFPASKEEAGRSTSEITFTYTLPSK